MLESLLFTVSTLACNSLFAEGSRGSVDRARLRTNADRNSVGWQPQSPGACQIPIQTYLPGRAGAMVRRGGPGSPLRRLGGLRVRLDVSDIWHWLDRVHGMSELLSRRLWTGSVPPLHGPQLRSWRRRSLIDSDSAFAQSVGWDCWRGAMGTSTGRRTGPPPEQKHWSLTWRM
jgi:hypothetical protein